MEAKNKYYYIPNLILTVTTLALFYVSFFVGDAENYLFPRLIVGSMVLLTLLSWFENDSDTVKNNKYSNALLPGLGICIAYVLMINFIGFYVGSWLTFFAIIMTYKSQSDTKNFRRTLLVKLGISTIFILVLYLLFTKILHVRMPEGVFF